MAVTGLALIAMLGADQEQDMGYPFFEDEIDAGTNWLRHQQDPDTGLIGTKVGHEFLYNHALATLALCEAYYATKSPLLKRTCQNAVDYISRARNPFGVWRYEEPPNGMNDTSVTGWMILALKSAERAHLTIDSDSFESALLWLDEVTDERTGRVGYTDEGSRSSRIVGANEHFPAESGEALTAIGLTLRLRLGQTDRSANPILEKHGDLILRVLPEWQAIGFANDMYYWYHGTLAMREMGGAYWDKWAAPMRIALREGQRQDGHERGSWDPKGPWGFSGGRVYATALMALISEAVELKAQEVEIETALGGLGYL